MLIQLGLLKEGVAKEVRHEYDAKELCVELVDLVFLAPLNLEGQVERSENTLHFQGTVESQVKRICGRSCKEIEEPLRIEFDLYLDVGEEDSIDVTDEIREVVLIEQPMVYYAPGEEPDEGAVNSDSEELNAEEKEKNPFEALKDIRDRLKEE